jgi:hypothetical protein
LDILEKVKVGEATQEEKMLVLKELNLTIEELNKLLGDVIEAMKNEIIK